MEHQYQLKNSKNQTGSPLMIISAKEPQPMANKYKVRSSSSIQDSPIHQFDTKIFQEFLH